MRYLPIVFCALFAVSCAGEEAPLGASEDAFSDGDGGYVQEAVLSVGEKKDASVPRTEASSEDPVPLNGGALAKLEPEFGCYLGAFLGNGFANEVTTPISQFIDGTHANKPHAIYSRYISYNESFPNSWALDVADGRHAIPMVNYRPTSGLDRIAEGDAQFNSFVTALKNFNRPVFVRFGYEMNGSSAWESWNNQSANYVAAFKRAAEYIHREAPEAAMVWCPNVAEGYPWGDTDEGDAYTSYYPADDGANLHGAYVDWVCLDFYANEQWGSAGRELVPTIGRYPESAVDFYQYFSAGLGKPMMIGETASLEDDGGDVGLGTGSNTLGLVQEHWLSELYNIDVLSAYPKLKAIVWFHVKKIENDLGGTPVWKDFRITSTAESANPQFPYYANLISDPYFLSGIPGAAGGLPPYAPVMPSGPPSGATGDSMSFETSATDPDGDNVRYVFDWCDGSQSSANYVPSGTAASKSKGFSQSGNYAVRAKAIDINLNEGSWSPAHIVNVTGPTVELLDDFESPVLLWTQYQGNGATLTKSISSGSSGQGMQVSYTQGAHSNYWGVVKGVGTRDWSAREGLQFRFKANSSAPIYVGVTDNDNNWGVMVTGSTSWETKTIYFSDFFKMPFEGGDEVLDLTRVSEVRFRHYPQDSASGTFWVDDLKVTGGGAGDRPPCISDAPSGPPFGVTGAGYSFSSIAYDPDGNDVRLVFDWGDATQTETPLSTSGSVISADHVWPAAGNYSVRVRAVDANGNEGAWGNEFTVSIDEAPPPDTDGDGIEDGEDICPLAPVHDSVGDPCNHDEDGDGADDGIDNCPFAANPDQMNEDGDARGAACEANDREANFSDSEGGFNEQFGNAVAGDGERFVAGAYLDGVSGAWSGSALVFGKAGGIWQREARLVPSDAQRGDNFGNRVAIAGDYIAVSSPGSRNGPGPARGAAYIYKKEGEAWVQKARVRASLGKNQDKFGISVALSENYLAVGASGDDVMTIFNRGAVYVFEKGADEWGDMTETAKLVPSGGQRNDNFGHAIAIAGEYIAVGAYNGDGNAGDSGAVYVFAREGGVWLQKAKLTASDGAGNDRLGYSVSASGNSVASGAYWDDDNGMDSGSAYVFDMPAEGWHDMTESRKLLPGDGGAGGYFGLSVSMRDGAVAVGSPGKRLQRGGRPFISGGAYVFSRGADGWAEDAILQAGDASANDSFGWAVSIDGPYVLVGAIGDTQHGVRSGSVYVYRR